MLLPSVVFIVIFVFPLPFASTIPLSLTVATLVLSELNSNFLLLAFSGNIFTSNFFSVKLENSIDDGLTSKLLTFTSVSTITSHISANT